MTRSMAIRISEEEFEFLQKMAKASGKKFSHFAREKLFEGIKQEAKEMNLLNKLITKLEAMEVTLPGNELGRIETKINNVFAMFLLQMEALKVMAKFIVLVPDKQREFLRLLSEIEEKMKELS